MGKLIFIGCGLGDDKAMTLAALDALRGCDAAVAEFYTSRPVGVTVQEWCDRVGRRTARTIEVLSREDVESGSAALLSRARTGTLCFLTMGDALSATTHQVLRAEALAAGIEVEVVHGASIVTAVPGLTGLSDYKFGRTTTLAFPDRKRGYFPRSPYEAVRGNLERGLHTLVLLDLRVEGPDAQPRFLAAPEGIALLLEMARLEAAEGGPTPFDGGSPVLVVARAGSRTPLVAAGPARDMMERDVGPPLHALAIPGAVSDAERDAVAAATGFRLP